MLERRRSRSMLALAVFGGLTAAAALAGGRSTREGVEGFYRKLDKPAFTPPDWVFAPVWTALYALMALSAHRVWRQPPSRARSTALGLWGTQLGLNAAWSWLFFGRRRKKAALADIAALWGSIAGYTAVARRVDRPAAQMMVPYLAWTTYAGALNASIVRRNPGP